ncbi:LADA_0G03114g1_1 [Lachancea dasiensis]|uniref:Polynucleotide 5'-hydroxyl-kinase GRC3 n=1 Tax=Lachancea dasiensis TaxID=1072105 RepID=A0A1G4JRK1_9SACH|nr:LADA_0G03114g1_1 [Lachancea dasiensis]
MLDARNSDDILSIEPQYDQGLEDDDSISSISDSGDAVKSDDEVFSSSSSEYDDDVNGNIDAESGKGVDQTYAELTDFKWQHFSQELGVNTFILNENKYCIILGLKKYQEVMICGSFQLRILKGGITYNDVHYNASRELINIWHPTCSAMSPIGSSFYAGWDERSFMVSDVAKTGIEHQEFECVLSIQDRCLGLQDISGLNTVFRDLWVPQHFQRLGHSSSASFSIVSKDTLRDLSNILTLTISPSWSAKLAELSQFHQANLHDMRVMVLGGKNCGKSTFLRLLLQRLLHTNEDEHEPIFYLDLDPGQPEFSRPDCISLSKIDKSLELGNPLAQSNFTPIAERYIGTNSPSSFPTQYLKEVSELFDSFSSEFHMGTTLLNVPGWIKGFGIQILNYLINNFKPTHIVLVDSGSGRQSFINELQINSSFTSFQRENYQAQIDSIDGYHGSSFSTFRNRFHASHLRQFRLLSHFHTLSSSKKLIKYDFTPLVKTAPLRVSFGDNDPIKGFVIEQNTVSWSDSHLKDALEGTIVGIYKLDGNFLAEKLDSVPVLKNVGDGYFLSLGLIHSIDTTEAYINIYLPFLHHRELMALENDQLYLRRRKTETPQCELYPSNECLVPQGESDIPFLSFKRQKNMNLFGKFAEISLEEGTLKRSLYWPNLRYYNTMQLVYIMGL